MGCAIHRSEGLADGAAGYLQMARESRGISLGAAATRLSMAADELRAIERGENGIPTGMIRRAELLYGYPTRFFLRPMPSRLRQPQEVYMCGEGIEVCDHHSCAYCADYLCDWPMGKGKTCDAALCEDHAVLVGEDMYFCPAHQAAALMRKSEVSEPASLDEGREG